MGYCRRAVLVIGASLLCVKSTTLPSHSVSPLFTTQGSSPKLVVRCCRLPIEEETRVLMKTNHDLCCVVVPAIDIRYLRIETSRTRVRLELPLYVLQSLPAHTMRQAVRYTHLPQESLFSSVFLSFVPCSTPPMTFIFSPMRTKTIYHP